MSEVFSSKQDKADTTDNVRDFVSVDSYNRAHVPAGSGKNSGRFLTDHELKMIEAHSEQIYDGLENKEAENLLENAVGVLTDPSDVRESLFMHGYIDEEEREDWSDEEILAYVAEKRNEVISCYGDSSTELNTEVTQSAAAGKRRANVEVDSESQANAVLPGKHRVGYVDAGSPIYDELMAKQSVGSIEIPQSTSFDVDAEVAAAKEKLADEAARKEAEAVAAISGSEQAKADRELLNGSANVPHEKSDTGADDLEMLAVNETEAASASADDLEILDETAAEDTTSRRSRSRRIRDALTLSGFAGEFSAWTTRERSESHRNRTIAVLGGAALLIGGGLLLMKGHDIFGNGSGSGSGTPNPNPSPTGPGTGGVNPGIPGNGNGNHVAHQVETVRVNHGDGEIKVTQRILENHGVRVNTTEAQQIGEHAGVHDILKGDDSYTHSGSTMDRIGDTGEFKVRKGVVSKLLRAAKFLNRK